MQKFYNRPAKKTVFIYVCLWACTHQQHTKLIPATDKCTMTENVSVKFHQTEMRLMRKLTISGSQCKYLHFCQVVLTDNSAIICCAMFPTTLLCTVPTSRNNLKLLHFSQLSPITMLEKLHDQ
jgi:hypothetical protein